MKKLRPTIRDVARKAGVSTVTVSRVVSDSSAVKDGTKRKVLAAMRALGYQPNAAARAMRTNSTKTIGFLVPDLRNELFAAVARAAEELLAAQGYMLFLYSSDRSTRREINFLNQATQRGMDGLILSLCDETDSDVMDAIGQCHVPVVIWDRDVPVEADVVFNEHAAPMRTVTKHLLDLGHRSIALISAPLCIRPGRERLRGFSQAIDAHPDKTYPVVRNGSQSADFGYSETLDLMASKTPPTAIIAGGNDIFHGVMKALRSLNLRIPDDISVVGTDDRLVSELADPPITVIDRDMERIGRALARMLIARLNGEQPPESITTTMESNVVLRSSTAAPGKAERPAQTFG